MKVCTNELRLYVCMYDVFMYDVFIFLIKKKGKIKTNFLPPRGSEEDEERDYAAKEVDRDWNGISGLKKVFIERLDTRSKTDYHKPIINS